MKIENITVSHNGRTVYGYYYQPERTGEKVPAVLFSHGYGGDKNDFHGTAEALAEQGIASVTYSFCGGSTRDESGFSSTEMTLFTEREDCLAVLAWLKAQPAVDPERVYLLGASMGGMVSTLAMAEQLQAAAGLVLYFPAYCIPDDWNRNLPDEDKIPDSLNFWGLELGRGFFTSMRTLNIYDLMPQICCPVRIFHGDQDGVVPLSYAERAVRAFPNAELHVFPGEGHGFSAESCRYAEGELIRLIRSSMEE